MSYGPNFPDHSGRGRLCRQDFDAARSPPTSRRAATKFDLVINLTTAKGAGGYYPERFAACHEVIDEIAPNVSFGPNCNKITAAHARPSTSTADILGQTRRHSREGQESNSLVSRLLSNLRRPISALRRRPARGADQEQPSPDRPPVIERAAGNRAASFFARGSRRLTSAVEASRRRRSPGCSPRRRARWRRRDQSLEQGVAGNIGVYHGRNAGVLEALATRSEVSSEVLPQPSTATLPARVVETDRDAIGNLRAAIGQRRIAHRAVPI